MKHPLPARPIEAAGVTIAPATVRQLFRVVQLIEGTDLGSLMGAAYGLHLADASEPVLAAVIEDRREQLAPCVGALANRHPDWFADLKAPDAMAVVLAIAKANADFFETATPEPEDDDSDLNEAEKRLRKVGQRKRAKGGDGLRQTLCDLVEAGYADWQGIQNLTYAELRYIADGHYAAVRERACLQLDIAAAAQSEKGYKQMRDALTSERRG